MQQLFIFWALSQTLRINDELPIVINDKRRSRLPSISAMEVFFEIEASFQIFYNIYFSQLSYTLQSTRSKILLSDISK